MKRVLRITGIVLAILVAVFALLISFVYFQSESLLNQTFEFQAPELVLPEASEEVLAEGQRIFNSRGCADCHGANGEGDFLVDEPVFGQIVSSNITHGEGGVDYEAQGYLTAIMHGVSGDGRGLIIMPSQSYNQMREEEIGPLIVFLLNLPPVDNVLPETSLGPIGRIVLLVEPPMPVLTINHEAVGFSDIAAEPSIEYGEYLFSLCSTCHYADAAGGAVPGESYNSANLSPSDSGIGAWSEGDFMTALRTGQRPNAAQLDPSKMPWTTTAHMNDTEITALYLYLRSIPPVENEN